MVSSRFEFGRFLAVSAHDHGNIVRCRVYVRCEHRFDVFLLSHGTVARNTCRSGALLHRQRHRWENRGVTLRAHSGSDALRHPEIFSRLL